MELIDHCIGLADRTNAMLLVEYIFAAGTISPDPQSAGNPALWLRMALRAEIAGHSIPEELAQVYRTFRTTSAGIAALEQPVCYRKPKA